MHYYDTRYICFSNSVAFLQMIYYILLNLHIIGPLPNSLNF